LAEALVYIDQILQHQLLVVQAVATQAAAVAVMSWQTTPQDKDFQAVRALDLIVKLKTVTKQVAVVVQVVQDLVLKMIVTKAAWVKAVPVQPMIF
jgi:hypothetical protein